jgi:hypothetical protein
MHHFAVVRGFFSDFGNNRACSRVCPRVVTAGALFLDRGREAVSIIQLFLEVSIMKRYAVPTVVVLVVLALVLVSFGQEQATRQGQGQGQGRGGMSSEERTKAIEAIEAQLAKLKAGSQGAGFNRDSLQNMSEEERTKAMEKFRLAREERDKALQVIIGQVAALQGRREPAPEGAQYLIIATTDLKPIQDAAVKEKATETAKLLEGLATRGSGRGSGAGRRSGPAGGTEGGAARTRSGSATR